MKFTSEPTPEQLLDLSQGAKLASLADPLTQDLEKLMEQTSNKVYKAISEGKLTPDFAIQSWHEMNSYKRLLQRFNQRIKVGQTVGEALHKGE